MKNIYKLNITFFLISLFLIQSFSLKSQTFEEMDYVVMNRLYDFLIDYENSLNSESFAKSDVMKYFYNDQIEMYNDLNDNQPICLPLHKYLIAFDSLKSGSSGYEVFHYDLKLLEKQTKLYYDLIHIQLLKENNVYPIYPRDTILEIERYNIVKTNRLNFTLIYNKFDPENRFKILKVELAEQSYIPSGWHRKEIPDELKFSVGPTFSSISGNSDLNMNYSHKAGLQGSVTVQNRFAGGLNYALSWYAGFGATYLQSEWNLKFDSIRENYSGQDFDTEVISSDISQDLSLLYLDVPIGISARYFPMKKISFSLNAEIKPWYLLSSNYLVNQGSMNYSGYFTYSNNQMFHFENMPEPYGFTNYNGKPNQDGVSMKKFGANIGLSFQINYKISDYLDFFIQPSWQTGITDLLESDESLSLYNLSLDQRGVVNPLVDMMEAPKFSMTAIEAGVVFRLNNIVKPFIPEFKFKDKERKDQKDNFYEYLVNKIPDQQFEKPYMKRKTRKVEIEKTEDFTKYPSNIRYSYGPDLGIENNFLKTGKTNKIKPQRENIFYFKPFGFELAKENESNPYSINHQLLYDTLNMADSLEKVPVKYQMSSLPDLNVFIVTKMNEGERGVRGRIIQNYKERVTKLSENKCALYFNETHGSQIKDLYEDGVKNQYCFQCNSAWDSFDKIEKKDQDKGNPGFGFMNELRILLSKEFTLERRNINMHFLSGNEDAFISIFEDLQNFSVPDVENINSAEWSKPNDNDTVKRNMGFLKQEILSLSANVDQFKELYFYLDQTSQDSIYNEISDKYLFMTKSEKKIWDNYYEFIIKDDPKYNREKAIVYKQLFYFLNNQNRKKSIQLRNFEFIKY